MKNMKEQNKPNVMLYSNTPIDDNDNDYQYK